MKIYKDEGARGPLTASRKHRPNTGQLLEVPKVPPKTAATPAPLTSPHTGQEAAETIRGLFSPCVPEAQGRQPRQVLIPHRTVVTPTLSLCLLQLHIRIHAGARAR